MNLEKYRVDESIRLCYLKHGGNVLKVAEELSLDIGYVRKIAKKYRKAQKNDICRLVANDISRHILLGSEQRRNRLIEIINALADEKINFVSSCCNVPVKEHIFDGETHYTCILCGEECLVNSSSKKANYDMILKYNEQLRAEDELLMTFAEKMGYTDSEPPVVNKTTQYNFTLSKGSKNLKLDSDVIQQVETMKPAEREMLRKTIQNTILKDE